MVERGGGVGVRGGLGVRRQRRHVQDVDVLVPDVGRVVQVFLGLVDAEETLRCARCWGYRICLIIHSHAMKMFQ